MAGAAIMIHLRIPGEPVAKQRPRFSRGRTYTPQKTLDAEERIAAIARLAGVEPMEGPLRMTVRAIYEPPKSWSKRKRQAAMGEWKETRPDRDNIEKLVADALNGIAYADDAQIVTGRTEKMYGQENATIIRIEPAPDRAPLGEA